MRNTIKLLCFGIAFALPAGHALASDTFMLPAPDLAKMQLEDSKNGGAYRYGIQIPGDGFSFDGSNLEMDAYDFLKFVRQSYVVGDQVIINLIREGKRLDLPMKLEKF